MGALNNSTSPVYWKRLVGILCVFLVLLGGTLEATHSHPSDRIDHDCPLCVAAHSAAQITVFEIQPETVRLVDFIVDPTPLPRRRFVALALYIRPPPVDSAFA
jgi:hypothetical protein